MDASAVLGIAVIVASDEDGGRAQASGLRRRHGGADTVGSGFVAGGRNYPSASGATDDHRATGQGGIEKNLHRGIERVHIDVENAGLGIRTPGSWRQGRCQLQTFTTVIDPGVSPSRRYL